jgi:DNA invertase Pin-like site-specific DNA recombinase
MTRAAVAYLTGAETEEELRLALATRGKQLEIVEVLHGERGPRHGGLAEALELIVAGEASTLVALRLAALAGSLRELVAVLDWLEAASADLIALDVGLDTRAANGRRTVAALREIERLEREPEAGRPPRGRPGIAAGAPELGGRIAAMRDRGLSLQAIADALNAERVPTPRGGARWRPSSVQAALGYRRPRPPLRGTPPPPHPPLAPPSPGRPRPAPPRRSPGGSRQPGPPERP